MKKLFQADLNLINGSMQQSIGHDLGLKVTEIGDDYMLMEMPVTPKSHQPMGLLHGGVSAYIIETIGSIASTLLIDLKKEYPVGLEINANHVKGVKTGTLLAKAKLVHGGRRTHLWQVDIHNKENSDLICTGRLTVMIVAH